MTKFILHGGVMSPRSESNAAFYREMASGSNKPNVLLVYFSRKLSEYDYLFERDRGNFAWANPGLKADYYIATIETFQDDLETADIVMFAGGDTDKLFEAVTKSGVDIHEALKDKVVAGSSAGAYLLADWYYTNSGREVRKGMGLVPVGAWAHFGAKRGDDYYLNDDEIKSVRNKLTEKVGAENLALLPEQQFMVFNQL